MSDMNFKETLLIARQLVGRLPGEMNDQLQELITRAEEDQDPNIGLDIVDLLTQHDNIRRWMNEQVKSSKGRESFTDGNESQSRGDLSPLAGVRGYEQLAGVPSSVTASRKWICREFDCTQSLPVILEGEDAPRCRLHGCVMVRDR